MSVGIRIPIVGLLLLLLDECISTSIEDGLVRSIIQATTLDESNHSVVQNSTQSDPAQDTSNQGPTAPLWDNLQMSVQSYESVLQRVESMIPSSEREKFTTAMIHTLQAKKLAVTPLDPSQLATDEDSDALTTVARTSGSEGSTPLTPYVPQGGPDIVDAGAPNLNHFAPNVERDFITTLPGTQHEPPTPATPIDHRLTQPSDSVPLIPYVPTGPIQFQDHNPGKVVPMNFPSDALQPITGDTTAAVSSALQQRVQHQDGGKINESSTSRIVVGILIFIVVGLCVIVVILAVCIFLRSRGKNESDYDMGYINFNDAKVSA